MGIRRMVLGRAYANNIESCALDSMLLAWAMPKTMRLMPFQGTLDTTLLA